MRNEIISTTILPAPAGFYSLWATYDEKYDEEAYIHKAPIIGWKVELYEDEQILREPITAAPHFQEFKDRFNTAVLAPDGVVYSDEDDECTTQEWEGTVQRYVASLIKDRVARSARAGAIEEAARKIFATPGFEIESSVLKELWLTEYKLSLDDATPMLEDGNRFGIKRKRTKGVTYFYLPEAATA